MKEQIRHIIGFFRYGLWQLNEDDTTPFKWIMIEILKKLVLAIRFFTAKHVVNKAAALTYSSLLAIVPILAVVFAIPRQVVYHPFGVFVPSAYSTFERLQPHIVLHDADVLWLLCCRSLLAS